MKGDRLEASSSGAVPLDEIVADGVRKNPDIDVLATRDNHGVSIMIWNYHDEDVAGPVGPITLSVADLPVSAHRILVTHYRIDANHSNAYSVWKGMGSPQEPTPEQNKQLEAAGQLQLFDSPNWLWNRLGSTSLRFDLPRQAISLIRFEW
jgi:xylan 1,4-beta-xylosidase